jgi:hypothetical protein
VAAALPVADFTAAIAERAYFKAQRRGFAPGHELEDWLAAERELDSLTRPPPAVTAPKRAAAPRKNGAVSKTKASKTK